MPELRTREWARDPFTELRRAGRTDGWPVRVVTASCARTAESSPPCKNLQAVPEQASTSGCERPRCGTADPVLPGSAAVGRDYSRPSKPRVGTHSRSDLLPTLDEEQGDGARAVNCEPRDPTVNTGNTTTSAVSIPTVSPERPDCAGHGGEPA